MRHAFGPWRSVAFRMAFNYSALLVLTLLVLFAIFYLQTVTVLQHRIDKQILANAHRLQEDFLHEGQRGLIQQIQHIFRDDIYSDTEIYLLTDAEGHKLIGNIPAIPSSVAIRKGLADARVIRNGRETYGRMMIETLSDGSQLLVGSDINHQLDIEALFNRAGLIAGLLGILMSIGAALLFRRELRIRISSIHQLVTHVKQGDLSQRIPLTSEGDEFSRLNADINDMLDQQQRLMAGVRHVSNTIAHNLRTPLTRILLRLRKSDNLDAASREQALHFTAREIEELGVMFDKLLNIAEVEAGTRRQAFVPVVLNDLVTDVIDLYEPVAEENGSTLTARIDGNPVILGDRDLLGSAIANLVDNALKYAGKDATVDIRTALQDTEAVITVQDNGPGIDEALLPNIGRHFYRADRQRPGHGLGVASILAIVQLHGGQIRFANASPGLIASMRFPAHDITES